MLWLLLLTAGLASPDAFDEHVTLAAEASRAEEAGQFAEAHNACVRALATMQDGPRAAHCQRRIAFLEARRDADGGFESWSRLHDVRRSWRTRDPEDARAEVVEVLSWEGVPSLVRADAVLWLARDSLTRRGDAQEALDVAASATDVDALPDDLSERLADIQRLARARLGRGEAKAGASGDSPDAAPSSARSSNPQPERTAAVWLSWGSLALYGLTMVPVAARRDPPASRPTGLIPLGLALAAGWAIAEASAPGTGAAVPYLACGFTAIYLISARALPRLDTPRRRVGAGLLTGLATLAVLWLALDHTANLDWVGW